MPEIPTYRVTGDDWDQPEPPRQAVVAAPVPLASTPAVADAPSVGPRMAGHSQATPFQAISPAVTDPGAGSGFSGPPSFVTGGGAVLATLPRSRLLEALARRAPALAPTIERVPPRLLLGGAVVVVAAVAVLLIGSSRPGNVAATATAAPTVAAPVATPSCAALGASPGATLPAPVLSVETRGTDPRRLFGFGPSDAAVDLEGPWPAELGSVEATVLLGSTLRLSAGSACIREWRAVVAHPPTATGGAWRPDEPDTLQLGWQKADRVQWEPAVPLPPRGEWVMRVTIWYRDGGPPAEATESAGAPLDLVVERYFRVSVEAPSS